MHMWTRTYCTYITYRDEGEGFDIVLGLIRLYLGSLLTYCTYGDQGEGWGLSVLTHSVMYKVNSTQVNGIEVIMSK